MAQVVQRSGPSREQVTDGRGTGVTPRRWRRLAPALAAAAIGGIALAGLLTFGPSRELVLGRDADAGSPGAPATAASTPATALPPTGSASPADRPANGRAEPDREAPAGAPAVTRTEPSVPSASPAVRPCRNSDVRVSVAAQNDNAAETSTRKAIVSVVNESATACRVDGRVTIQLYDAADEAVPVPTQGVDQPGPAAEIVLRPGNAAFQGIKWQACDLAAADCPAGNTLRGSLGTSSPGVVAVLEGFSSPQGHHITMRTLQLGTLQPATDGTVAW
ncbi:DUF4232 domain-containing protein [Couchioplanes caeruleus]|uniref:DUF4232 domain-containing protein n=2 Tax=Couchioplanes caeruleus TaxID=56438 RepID=UPI0014770D91|nr:DUF4232 domain-containing protein [Couchioplanes caeruleus]